MSAQPQPQPRRQSTSYELYLELRAVDPRMAEDYHHLLHTLLPRLRNRALYAGRLWLGDIQRSGIVAPVQAETGSRHEAWVDWFDEARQTLEQLLSEAP
jgi:hypothetical protein